MEKLISHDTIADPSGEHILHIAANCQHTKMIELLTARWPGYINMPNDDGITPLHVACMYGQLSAIKALMESGADPFLVDNEGMTPLEYCIQEGHGYCVDYFKDVGINQDDTVVDTAEEDSMAIAYTLMETTLMETTLLEESTLYYTLADITLNDTSEDYLTNSMLRAELIQIGEKPGPINELTRGAYLRYLHKARNGLLPVQTQETNSKLFLRLSNSNL